MLELIWRFQISALDDESVVLPLMSAIADTPGLSARRYDLNQKEQWRGFELDRAVVDALTQRTQLMRIQGESPEALALIAFGKRDEQPTAIIRLPDEGDLAKLVSRWTGLYDELPLESTVISAGNWRRALQSAGLPTEVTGGLLGMVFGWRRGAAPQGIAEIVASENVEGTPIRLEREANHLVLWLAEHAEVADEAHRKALEYVARRLLRAS